MRPSPAKAEKGEIYFNPRTPCGVRRVHCWPEAPEEVFQSTHPLRGATEDVNNSIPNRHKFQSTHPLRGATREQVFQVCTKLFQSTHPLRGATRSTQCDRLFIGISIHAPLAGCDGIRGRKRRRRRNFNPRTPCGVRPGWGNGRGMRYPISIHAPLAGCDTMQKTGQKLFRISIHAPLAGCD